MPIRPIDVRRKEFKNSFRGYDANQVDDFLDAVADEFERSYTENARMREEISSLRERLQQFEELEGSIRAALVHAEQSANDLRRTATQEAEVVRLSANREAEFTIREAKARAHQLLADSSARVERVQQSYEAMQEAKRTFTNDFRHLLRSYMDVMDNAEVATAKEIEASLRGRLDTEAITVAREAAAHDAGTEQEEAGLESSQREVADTREERPFATEDPGATQRLEPETTPETPQQDETVVEEPGLEPPAEVEPSAAQDSAVEETAPSEPAAEQPAAEQPAAERPAASEEVEREEPSLAEESSSQEFFDRDPSPSPEQDRGDSRIFRASRFLRRRE